MLTRLVVVLLALAVSVAPVCAQNVLAIHQINVQQGDCTLIVGPDGTTFLIDAGNSGKGIGEVVPYLQNIGIQPSDGLDFMLATHRDSDHLGGLDEVRSFWATMSTITFGITVVTNQEGQTLKSRSS